MSCLSIPLRLRKISGPLSFPLIASSFKMTTLVTELYLLFSLKKKSWNNIKTVKSCKLSRLLNSFQSNKIKGGNWINKDYLPLVNVLDILLLIKSLKISFHWALNASFSFSSAINFFLPCFLLMAAKRNQR